MQPFFTTLPLLIIPHATSCGGYNVFYLSVVSLSVHQSWFSCQCNSAQQNFMKLCTNEGHIYGKFWFILFSRSYDLLNLETWSKWDTTETGCQHNSSETAQQNFLKLCSCEGHNVDDVNIHRKFWFNFFSWLHPFWT